MYCLWIANSPFPKKLIDESFEVERTRILSPLEEKCLLAACDRWRQHLKPVIVFAIETGLRRGEIQKLKWERVDLGQRFVKVDVMNSKTLRSRLVPLSARAAETLAKLWQNSRKQPNAPVFGTSDFKRAFNTACNDAALLDVHFHDLRHTAITRWLRKGMTIADAMNASGHTQHRTFMRYVNQAEHSMNELAAILDRAA